MIDRELRDAHGLMRDHGLDVFQSTSVMGAGSPESFARYVTPKDWEPVDVAPKIGNVNKIIEMLGGEKLYGDHPEYALRELLQNAVDAVHAQRALGKLANDGGEVLVEIERVDDDHYRLSVSDDGVGMTKYVMTNVLLDFGNSLWRSDEVRHHLPGLASTNFVATGRFGIGFYSVLMLGEKVSVISTPSVVGSAHQRRTHKLEFGTGLSGRPTLSEITHEYKSGTRISIDLNAITLQRLLLFKSRRELSLHSFSSSTPKSVSSSDAAQSVNWVHLSHAVLKLLPMSDVRIKVRIDSETRSIAEPCDWQHIEDKEFGKRLFRRFSNEQKFFAIHDKNGKCAGRLNISWSYDAILSLSINGVLCGERSGFVGALSAFEPKDAARSDASVTLERECWEEWAKVVLDQQRDNLRASELTTLNALLPTEDPQVYERDDLLFNAEGLCELLSDEGGLKLHIGDVEYSPNADNFKEADFDDYFQLDSDVILCPKASRIPDLWASFNLTPTDYLEKLRAALDARSIPYEYVTRGDLVGTVLKEDVERSVHIFRLAAK